MRSFPAPAVSSLAMHPCGTCWTTVGALGWTAKGPKSMAQLATLLKSRPWWTLQPDQSHTLLTGGIGSGTSQSVAALASDRSYALIYTPSVRTLTVELGQLPVRT